MATKGEGTSKVMGATEFQAAIRAAITDAKNFIDDEISPDRQGAGKYYRGEKFGNEQKGRSQVVSRDVRDTVNAIMPSLMRIFSSPESVVEFKPRSKEDVALAEQQTDAIRYVIEVENPGFMILHSCFKNGMIYKTGVFKWWWESEDKVESSEYTGIPPEQIQMLLEAKGAELESMEPCERYPEGGYYDVTIKRKWKEGKARVDVLAPEEFLIDRHARSIPRADLVGHRADLTASELIAMGYSQEDIDAAQSGSDLELNIERTNREPSSIAGRDSAAIGEAMKRIPYHEVYVRVDYDGDGIAELRRVTTLGADLKVSKNEAVDEAPFAYCCPDPEPNVFFGSSVAEKVADIQLIKSQILRGMLDSLAQAIVNTPVVVEGQVNITDVLSKEIGRPVRQRQPGMYQEIVTPFVGKEAFPVLAYMDEMREQRTGITKASQGLDADALQSTTRAAVAATVTAAQQQIEMIARIFAETGIKDLFRGLLRLIARNQDHEKMMRLRNKWVPVDPRSWDTSMDMSVNIALGAGTVEDRLGALMRIAEKQELIIQNAGPQNPIVTIRQYANTLRKMVQLAGFVDADQFFNEITVEQEQAAAQAQQPQQQQDPNMIVAQATVKQIEADMQKKAAELQLEERKMLLSDDRERDKIDQDGKIRIKEIEAKYNVDMTKVQAQIEADKAAPRTQ